MANAALIIYPRRGAHGRPALPTTAPRRQMDDLDGGSEVKLAAEVRGGGRRVRQMTGGWWRWREAPGGGAGVREGASAESNLEHGERGREKGKIEQTNERKKKRRNSSAQRF